jgi:hypothetical protein
MLPKRKVVLYDHQIEQALRCVIADVDLPLYMILDSNGDFAFLVDQFKRYAKETPPVGLVEGDGVR